MFCVCVCVWRKETVAERPVHACAFSRCPDGPGQARPGRRRRTAGRISAAEQAFGQCTQIAAGFTVAASLPLTHPQCAQDLASSRAASVHIKTRSRISSLYALPWRTPPSVNRPYVCHVAVRPCGGCGGRAGRLVVDSIVVAPSVVRSLRT